MLDKLNLCMGGSELLVLQWRGTQSVEMALSVFWKKWIIRSLLYVMVLPIKIRNLSTSLHETFSVAPKSFPRQKKKKEGEWDNRFVPIGCTVWFFHLCSVTSGRTNILKPRHPAMAAQVHLFSVRSPRTNHVGPSSSSMIYQLCDSSHLGIKQDIKVLRPVSSPVKEILTEC